MNEKQILSELREHPRTVELRFSILYSDLIRAFGVENATRFVENVCNSFNINFNVINAVIAKRNEIEAWKRDKRELYRQQIVVMGKAYGFNNTYIAERMLKITRQAYYKHASHNYDMNAFYNKDWRDMYESSIAVLGLRTYYNEVVRFISVLEALREVV